MKTYTRPVTGTWWTRNGFYRWYMFRELSCVFITLYAFILLAGLYRLGQGPEAFLAWQAALASPASLAFHVVALVLVIYHSWTWFKIMPKTMPRLPVPDGAIVAGGVIAVIAVSAAFLWTALG
ncbi:MAG TPA: fumarate reductase subunit C [Burkholderiales bacterium]|nr:fumarate reductase subunit C [Burkholderiales bacterium]